MIEDILYPLLKFYQASPPSIKRIAGEAYRNLPDSWKFGRTYIEFKNLLTLSEKWTSQQLLDYQWRKLKETIHFAYKNITFYRKRWAEFGINPDKIKCFSDLTDIPFTTKQDVRDNPLEFYPNNISSSKVLKMSTGGTTGEPLMLYYYKGIVRPREWAFITHQWSRIGYKPGDLLAVFRSAIIRGTRNRRLWEYDPTRNRWIFSTFDLTDDNIPKMIDKLIQIKPKFLHVYPSALTIIASHLKERNVNLSINSLRGILSGSENTFPWQIKLFKDVFGCKVCRWYGLGELSALGCSCEVSDYYHMFPQYSYVELLDDEGKIVEREGRVGMIVGTTFDNPAMPLIRYKTQDYAERGPTSCSCGRDYLLISEIIGRSQEYVVTRDRSKIPLAPIIFGIHDAVWAEIRQVQFVQKEPGKLILKIAPGNNFNKNSLNFIRKAFLERLHPNFTFRIQIVDGIPRTSSGKHKYIDQGLH